MLHRDSRVLLNGIDTISHQIGQLWIGLNSCLVSFENLPNDPNPAASSHHIDW